MSDRDGSGPDRVSIVIGGREIDAFTEYRISSDLFEAADAWSVDLVDAGLVVERGARVSVRINNRTELNGIVDRIERSYDKSGRRLVLQGRDLMGLLVDSYCTDFPDLQGITLTDLAARLIRGIPFISGVRIFVGQGNKDRAVLLTEIEEEYKYVQIKPGQTIFEVLKSQALSRGMLFFAMPDGSIVFGEPATGGKAEFQFRNALDGRENNIVRASLIDDISRRYKTIHITGQEQGADDIPAGGQNLSGAAIDPSFPFEKPYVAAIDLDSSDPAKYARIIMDGQIFDGFSLELTVKGHSQNGKVYQVNTICHVYDEALRINEDLLCYARTFVKSKSGAHTTLKLSRPGVLPA